MAQELERMWVDPTFLNEVKLWKEELEKKVGFPLNGGAPTTTKILAKVLERLRTKNRKMIRLEINKMRDREKCEVDFIFDNPKTI